MRLLEIIRTLDPDMRKKVRFYQAGTSEMYGKVLETHKMNPLHLILYLLMQQLNCMLII